MKILDQKLKLEEIKQIRHKYGDYVKLTVDLEKELVIIGQELPADAEKILLEKGGRQSNICGVGINLKDKIVDTTAVMNLRTRLANDSMEILDPKRREKFIKIVKKFFAELWH